jgi:biopolymer transport protein TolR
VRINEEHVSWEHLGNRLEQIFKLRQNRVAFVRGDGGLEFQVLAKAIDIMAAAGVTSVGLMTPGLEKNSSAD